MLPKPSKQKHSILDSSAQPNLFISLNLFCYLTTDINLLLLMKVDSYYVMLKLDQGPGYIAQW
jgi:hypothetical protein